MRLTRRGKAVVILVCSVYFITHPLMQIQAVAPTVQIAPKKVVKAMVWTASTSQQHAKSRFVDYGWSKKQWTCLKQLWTKESNWRHAAFNKQPVTQIRDGKRVRLHAGGIPQILGLDPKTPVPQQIRKGMDYIESRYGTPCQAWAHWNKKAGKDGVGGWY